jgi:hypothetical protein
MCEIIRVKITSPMEYDGIHIVRNHYFIPSFNKFHEENSFSQPTP